MKLLKQLFVIVLFGALIAVGVSFSGLYNPAKKRLVGKWNMSFEMSQSDLREMGVTANPLMAATAQQLMKSTKSEMAVEFRNDDTVSMDMQAFGLQMGESGTWEVAQKSGDQVVIATKFEGDPAPQEWTIKFVDDDTFQMTPPTDSAFPAISQLMTFHRVQLR